MGCWWGIGVVGGGGGGGDDICEIRLVIQSVWPGQQYMRHAALMKLQERAHCTRETSFTRSYHVHCTGKHEQGAPFIRSPCIAVHKRLGAHLTLQGSRVASHRRIIGRPGYESQMQLPLSLGAPEEVPLRWQSCLLEAGL